MKTLIVLSLLTFSAAHAAQSAGPLQRFVSRVVPAAPLHRVAQYARLDSMRLSSGWRDLTYKLAGDAELFGLRFAVHRPYQAPVTSALWRGSRLDAAGLATLKARGFSAVVGLTAEIDLDKDASIEHLRIPIIDNHTPTLGQVREFLDFMKQHEGAGPVYVHCEAGVGRTGIMVAAYRMKVEHWSAGRAVVEARKYGMKERTQILFIRELGKKLDAI